MLESVLNVISVIGLAFPMGVISGELDRASRKHFQRLVKLTEAREALLLAEAAKTARALAAANNKNNRRNSNNNSNNTSNKDDTTTGHHPSFFDDTVYGSTKHKQYRNFCLAMQFKQSARLFQLGDYPPFPEGTRISVVQGEVVLALCEGLLEEKLKNVGRLQRKHDRFQVTDNFSTNQPAHQLAHQPIF